MKIEPRISGCKNKTTNIYLHFGLGLRLQPCQNGMNKCTGKYGQAQCVFLIFPIK